MNKLKALGAAPMSIRIYKTLISKKGRKTHIRPGYRDGR